MELILIRHGEKENGIHFNPVFQRNDPALTDRGHLQAECVAKYLEIRGITEIYSSDMKRTVQTAEKFSNLLGSPLIFKSQLREINFGLLESQGWNKFSQISPAIYKIYQKSDTDFHYPDGECGNDAFDRAFQVIEEISHKYSGEDIIIPIFTHGGIIKTLICGLLGIPFGIRFKFGAPLFNCSISSIRYDSKQRLFKLNYFNLIDHIPIEIRSE